MKKLLTLALLTACNAEVLVSNDPVPEPTPAPEPSAVAETAPQPETEVIELCGATCPAMLMTPLEAMHEAGNLDWTPSQVNVERTLASSIDDVLDVRLVDDVNGGPFGEIRVITESGVSAMYFLTYQHSAERIDGYRNIAPTIGWLTIRDVHWADDYTLQLQVCIQDNAGHTGACKVINKVFQ
jgi:hypothetical protein